MSAFVPELTTSSLTRIYLHLPKVNLHTARLRTVRSCLHRAGRDSSRVVPSSVPGDLRAHRIRPPVVLPLPGSPGP